MSIPTIVVAIELRDASPIAASLEVLGLARRLADAAAMRVVAIAIGGDDEAIGRALIAHGADRAILAAHPAFAELAADAWIAELERLLRAACPSAVLMAHTPLGAELAPRLAFRFNSGVATDCLAAQRAEGRFLFTRRCYGGKALEVVSFTSAPVIASFRAKTQPSPPRDDGRVGEIERAAIELDAAAARVRIVARRSDPAAGAALENARVVVAGGRGLQGPEGFALAAELASVLGGVVGASRAACDMGWCPGSYQIGLSGRTVAPELYLALGISGAPQHMAGCGGAKTIVAVNSDKDAPIFKFARFGIVGDCLTIIPALTAALRRPAG